MKRLTRSRTNRTLAGVMGGIGEYFNVDPVLIRVLYVFFTLVSGIVPGIVGYIIALILIPEDTPIIHEEGARDAHEGSESA